ncbi:MAG: hypothetical protein D6B28_01030 [Gammaproteobacteria bacterium]|nr:MAG: hypothetical protein D6B28_01030 [Gammaproteobacteria bacterium]
MAIKPEVGSWYQNETEDTFEVVAFDPEEDYIEIQYYDGAVEEIDLDTWGEMGVSAAEPPEDWSGSYDLQQEDYGVDLERHGGDDDWQNSVDNME